MSDRTYIVNAAIRAAAVFEVEASSPEEAKKKAAELAKQITVHLPGAPEKQDLTSWNLEIKEAAERND